MNEADAAQWLVLIGALVLAGLVHGTLGIGFPLVATPLLATVFDVRTAVLLTLLPTVAVNVLSVLHGGRWRENLLARLPLAVYALLSAVLGAMLLVIVDPAPFRLVLALIILLYLNVERVRLVPLEWVRTRPQAGMLVFGVLAGVSAGSVNVMVPFLVIYALEARLDKNAMVQVFNLCFLCGKLSQIAVFGAAGLLGPELLGVTALAAGAAIAALLVGMRVRARIDAHTYRRWLRRVLYAACVVLIVQFLLEARAGAVAGG